jgi:hypothetical protein
MAICSVRERPLARWSFQDARPSTPVVDCAARHRREWTYPAAGLRQSILATHTAPTHTHKTSAPSEGDHDVGADSSGALTRKTTTTTTTSRPVSMAAPIPTFVCRTSCAPAMSVPALGLAESDELGPNRCYLCTRSRHFIESGRRVRGPCRPTLVGRSSGVHVRQATSRARHDSIGGGEWCGHGDTAPSGQRSATSGDGSWLGGRKWQPQKESNLAAVVVAVR